MRKVWDNHEQYCKITFFDLFSSNNGNACDTLQRHATSFEYRSFAETLLAVSIIRYIIKPRHLRSPLIEYKEFNQTYQVVIR